jgi:hypothetical protein
MGGEIEKNFSRKDAPLLYITGAVTSGIPPLLYITGAVASGIPPLPSLLPDINSHILTHYPSHSVK